jgi:hypothetical protein
MLQIVNEWVPVISLGVAILSLIVTTVLAITLFYLSKKAEEKAQEISNKMTTLADRRSKKMTTLVVSRESFRVIDRSVGRKEWLDKNNIKDNKIKKDHIFDYDYINNNKDVETCVFSILNEYEAIALGVNEGLLDKEVILGLREKAIVKTYEQYGKYIKDYQELKPEAWVEFIKLVENLPKKV